MIAPPPPAIHHGSRLPIGPLHTTVLASMDFETFSLAGFEWREDLQKWTGLNGSTKDKGLPQVGTRIYAEHSTTEVLCMSYDLKDGLGTRRWRPGQPLPQDLFDHVAAGKLIEAHYSMMEKLIWEFVCVRRYGWPPCPPHSQWRCSAAKSRAWGLPGGLGEVGMALGTVTQKDKRGKELIKLLSMPQNPTKKQPLWRLQTPELLDEMQAYCDTDEKTESEVSLRVPDLIPMELDYWLCDQAINYRGIGVDIAAVRNCVAIVNQVLEHYNQEMIAICGLRTSQAKALVDWLAAAGVTGSDGRVCKSLAAAELEYLYENRDRYSAEVARVIEVRALTGSASVKKVFAMLNHATVSGRLCDLFIYHGARTGRDTHSDVQPGNLPKAGPEIRWCTDAHCGKPYAYARTECPWCGASDAFSAVRGSVGELWCFEAVEPVLEVIALQDMHALEWFFGDALLCITGVVRSLLCAAPGNKLVCSDYSSIEAVVLAALAGEQWRLDAFNRKEDIYYHGASGITGISYEEYKAWAKEHGRKHPDRQKIGKIAELALGFAGFSGALFAFGFEGDKKEAQAIVNKWRKASPALVELWGGQYRGVPWDPGVREFFGLEGCAIQAVLNPGQEFSYRQLSYQVLGDVLYCKLPSGRRLAYQQPRLTWGPPRGHADWAETYSLTYMTWNTNAKYGATGWVRMDTYAGRLAENCIASGTPVLTERGWVPIEAVRPEDRVHDGVEFVTHKGILYKGTQACISVDGVRMTPDHKVLCDDGWKEASQVQRPYRPDLRNVDGSIPSAIDGKNLGLGFLMRVRRGVRESWLRSQKGPSKRSNKQLRMHDFGVHCSRPTNPRHEPTPSLRGIQVHDRSLQAPIASGLAQLWRAGGIRLRALADLRGLLGRHGRKLPAWLRTGSAGQRRALLARELPLGAKFCSAEQSPGQRPDKHAGGLGNCGASFEALRHRSHDSALSHIARVARVGFAEAPRRDESPVYDLVDCGARHRFVVLGAQGPFIVHNCTQAVARDVMAYAVINLEKAGWPIVLRVHDELAAEIPAPPVADEWAYIATFEKVMADLPEWAEGWPIRAAGGWLELRYHKD